MFPAIESSTVRVGVTVAAADHGIERVDRSAAEIETARREQSQSDPRHDENGPPQRLAADSPVQLRSTESSVGTLLDVVA